MADWNSIDSDASSGMAIPSSNRAARPAAFTLVELLVVVSVLGLLLLFAVPSFSAIRRQARIGTCSANQRALFIGLMGYCNSSRQSLPPFAYAGAPVNLPRSGHWAGNGESDDPLGRLNMSWVNLGVLLADRSIPEKAIHCTEGIPANYFGPTQLASAYCLRMPYSKDLFAGVPQLMYYPAAQDGLLAAYLRSPGGQTLTVGTVKSRLPQSGLERPYKSLAVAGGGQHVADLSRGALLSDGFWGRDGGADVSPDWRHGRQFNVLYGDGAVKKVQDDGTVAGQSFGPEGIDPGSDGAGYATRAEAIWRFFDLSK